MLLQKLRKKYVSLKKNALSADKVGFSLINPVYLRKPIISACADSVGLSGKQSLPACAHNLTLSARADTMGFFRQTGFIRDKPTLSADNVGFFRETYII